MTGITWAARIDRGALLRAIGCKSEKIPANFEGTFQNVTIYHRDLETAKEEGKEPWQQKSRWVYKRVQFADVTIKVYMSHPQVRPNGRRAKSSAHRTFILCPRCSAEIPTGRFHQHVNTDVCDKNEERVREAMLGFTPGENARRDILSISEDARLSEAEQDALFAAAVNAVDNDPATNLSAIEQARQLVREDFTSDDAAKKFAAHERYGH